MSRRLLVCAASALALSVACGGAAAAASLQQPSGVMALGDTVEGSLTAEDWRDEDDHRADVWRFLARAGTRIEAVMRSDEFDTYLVAGRYGPGGEWEEITRDDDGLGEGLNSRVRFTAPEEGEYVIRARGYGADSEGGYSLALVDRGEAPAGPAMGSVAPGAVVNGGLQAGDAETDEGVRYDAYRFRAAAGDRLQITARSDAFDTVLEVGRETPYGGWEPLAYDDDGLGEGLNSRLNFTAPEAGDYVVRLLAYSDGGNGDYTLELTDRGPLPPPPPPTPLTLGQSVDGGLSDDDPMTGEEKFYDQYVVSGRRGQRLGVAMDSDAFDTLVEIGRLGPDGGFEALASNDDGPGAGLNSRLLFVPDQTGQYVVRATSFGSEATGDYQLSIRDMGPEPRAMSLRPGNPVNGTLSDNDGMTFSGGRYDLYRFQARTGERFSIELTSDAFDTVVDVLMSDGEGGHYVVASDDDGSGGESTNSRLTFIPLEDGDYFLHVKAFDPEGRGAYALTLRDLGPEPEPTPIAIGDTIEGALAEGDSVAGDSSLYDAYRFTGRAGQRFRVVMRSGDFDTFLLLGRHGEYGLEGLAEDDDGLGEGTDSRINFTAPEDGTYEIWANSFGAGESGAYALQLIDLGPAPEPGSLVIGATVRGELGGDDPTSEHGAFYDAYRVHARAGERVRLTLTSNAFDTLVEFGRAGEGGAFELIDSDDDGLSDLNSRLDVEVPETGAYLVRARSFAAGATGEYVLTVEPAPAAAEVEAEAIAAAEPGEGVAPDADGASPAGE